MAEAVDNIDRSVEEVRPGALRSDGRCTRPAFPWEELLESFVDQETSVGWSRGHRLDTRLLRLCATVADRM